MTLPDQVRTWLDTHVSDQEGREDMVRSLTDFVEQEIAAAGYVKSTRLAEVEAEAAVLLAFADKVRDMATGGTWKEMLDNDVELMKEANRLCEDSPLATAHLAEVERLKANQRTDGAREICPQCGFNVSEIIPSLCNGIVVDDGPVQPCPIRTPSEGSTT